MKKGIIAVSIASSICAIAVQCNYNENKIKKLDEQINDANKEIKNIKNENEQLKNDNSEMENQIKEYMEKIDAYNAKVSYNRYDVTQLSKATLSHMQRALEGTELYDNSQSFIDAEEEYGVNSFFIAAIAAQESGWGTSDRAKYQNNLTGHAVYDSKAKGTYFQSEHDSIMNTAKLLKEKYLTEGGESFNGYSAIDVNKRYCFLEDRKTIDYNWSNNISSIASDLVYKANNFKKI